MGRGVEEGVYQAAEPNNVADHFNNNVDPRILCPICALLGCNFDFGLCALLCPACNPTTTTTTTSTTPPDCRACDNAGFDYDIFDDACCPEAPCANGCYSNGPGGCHCRS
ncbi:unnamed protein product [Adineta steineri]|uniref:Uncharacterized protein n=2 Tax=Adineta steineri TaxID=433720 RepID=A0A818U2A0_9BILA|nr:unnamed protein product [Adineta steineri]CAF1314170.1 unnamed protein product [Adineta steineri]CAF3694604.1 unnamed protein product [Adineta steineri]CAF4162423.1 unnamed protein product [Adineta steineri]CAF4248044.1 unnamed protein product [Adineta steineri]